MKLFVDNVQTTTQQNIEILPKSMLNMYVMKKEKEHLYFLKIFPIPEL